MAIPKVGITVQDGAFGIVAPSQANRCAVVGPAKSGALNTTILCGSIKAVVETFEAGPAAEAAAAIIQRAGGDVLVVRSDAVAGDFNEDDAFVGTGTSAISLTGSPVDGYDVVFSVATGGTIGVTGIKFTVSLDNGATNGGVQSLGTASTYAVPGTGITFNFGSGTLVAGDKFTQTTIAPQSSAAHLEDALTALGASPREFGYVLVCGDMTASTFDQVASSVGGFANAYRYVSALGNVLMRGLDQADSAYQASSAITSLAGKANLRLVVGADGGRLISPITSRKLRRPASWFAAAEGAAFPLAESAAQVDHGPLPNVDVFDQNGNVVFHDEFTQPGLNELRFLTLRTIIGKPGAYVTKPNIFGVPGSDFTDWHYRRVMDEACRITYAVLVDYMSKGVRLDKATGYILEQDARGIESAVNSALRNGLTAKQQISNAACAVSRTDDILETKTINVAVRILPLGYLEDIEVNIGFTNPALA